MILSNEIALPRNYGYPILVLGSAVYLNYYLQFNVVKARKKYGVKAPTLYLPDVPSDADEKEKKRVHAYNCAQRAHQNTCESLGLVMLNMMATGIVYPITSAAFGGIWVVGRFIYGYLYINNPEKKRYGGLIWHLGEFPLGIMAFKVAYDLLIKK